jgi:DNA-binding response OmpR family regulator
MAMGSDSNLDTKKRILIVDDDPHHNRIVTALLEAEGYLVAVATDSPSAVHKSGDFHPDLVLLDMMMPKYDGTTASQAMKELYPDTPIIIVSAKDAPVDVQEGLEWGANRYITKPFDPKELLEAISEFLSPAN